MALSYMPNTLLQAFLLHRKTALASVRSECAGVAGADCSQAMTDRRHTFFGQSAVHVMAMLVVMFLVGTTAFGQESAPKTKTTGKALGYSLGATFIPAVVGALSLQVAADRGEYGSPMLVAGYVIGSAGLVFGPGAGHWYAGNSKRFWTGSGFRSLCGLAFYYGAWATADDSQSHTLEAESLIGGAVGMAVMTVYDIATVGGSVRAHNQEHRTPPVGVSVAPDLFQRKLMFTLSIRL